jgi:type 1 glutamine amidotransferase
VNLRLPVTLLAVAATLVHLAHAAPPVRIVFAAGPKDHGAPGRHEYARDLASLKGCLDHSNIPNVATQLYADKVPDAAELGSAAVLVMESSGDRTATEHHVLFPQDATTDHVGYDAPTAVRLTQIDALVKKGMGVVVLHYATYVNNASARKYFVDWVGSYYESGYSRTVVADWNIAPTDAKHPILRGVTPWTAHEEFYINYRMTDDPRRTPLLLATPTVSTPMPPVPAATAPLAGPPAVDPPSVPTSLVSWAIQRPDGGRGFVMTGVDWHKNLEMDSYRRQVLNGIVWAARLDVPASGVVCGLPDGHQIGCSR